jgi:DNA-binding IclR family transcriptional regulator
MRDPADRRGVDDGSRAERTVATSAVARVSAVLNAFDGSHPELGVSQISRRSGLPTSTTSRLVGELVTHGFLERDGHRLHLGTRMFELGELASRHRNLRAIALPYMADLRTATGQTIHLAVLDAIDVVYVEIVHSRTSPKMPSRVGGRLPAHAAAVGKALLAFSDEGAVDALCAHGLVRVGPRTLTVPALLRRELQRVRRAGTAYDHEESGPGVGCVASPVLGVDGVAVAALSVSGWSGRLDLRRLAPAVRTAALAVSRELHGPTDEG